MDHRLPQIISPARNSQSPSTVKSPAQADPKKQFHRESPAARRRIMASYPQCLPTRPDSDDPISPPSNQQLSQKFSESRQQAETNKKNRLANGNILAHKQTEHE